MRTKILLSIIVFILGILLNGVHAQPVDAEVPCPLDSLQPRKVQSLETFKKIAVLNHGRVKPLETYAQNLLLQLSGKRTYQKESAVEWTARFMFAPRTTYDDKIFLINNPDILEALKIEPDKHRRYSFRQIDQGFEKLKELAEVINTIDEKSRSVVDQEILRVFGNLRLYSRISGAFSFAVPHPDFTIESAQVRSTLGLSEKQTLFSFYEILSASGSLEKVSKDLSQKNETEWNKTEQHLARILSALNFWTEHYSQCPIGLIPTKAHTNEEWISPMDTILVGFFDPDYNREIKLLKDLAEGYWNGSQLEFDMSARAFNDSVSARLSAKEKISVEDFSLELFYNQFNLLFWAKIIYFCGFLLFLFSLTFQNKYFYRFTFFLTLLGFLPHLIALILRIFIMNRPPVSNLFETFIFVGLISVLLGILMELINKNWLGLIVANVCGFILLTIAGKYSSEGDTMQVLVAVLNSNFWLSTHVIAITIGYAGCSVAGIMGHIYILQLFNRKNPRACEITYSNMLGVLGFGLAMSFLGTMLGGIWADQSWGRFWGWDPKENGALMIVLWSSIVFHAKIAKLIHPLGVAVGCILALMNVVWAWFGVNLLNVGLHSYGFTSGIANSLAIYATIEVLFISVTVLLLGRQKIKF